MVQLVGSNGTPCFRQESLLPLASTFLPFPLYPRLVLPREAGTFS